ncbi:MFS transporter [Methylobacterium oryzisoli]|uniref:MFS transporter n=1 Tax=Methylobacterium oryzisoli TaxID=3385502 RepID=UPI0038927B72
MTRAGHHAAAAPGFVAAASDAVDPRDERRNLARLVIAQALGGANATIVFATGAIIGHTLAPSPALATLPISLFVVGMALCTLPAGWIAQRHGRRAAFLAGTACGILVGLLAAAAIVLSAFWLFCVATVFGGAYAAVVLSFRFAAADCVPSAKRARALSAVMAGGVAAGVIGPQLVTATMHAWPPHLFAITYLAAAGIAALCAVVLAGVRLPVPAAQDRAAGRPLGAIVRQPRFVTAVICGVVSYTLMNFVMTSAPLAMRLCGLSQEASNLGLQWHVIAMYGPSFVTGHLIARYGAPRIVLAGLVLTAAAAAAGLTGVEVAHFWLTLILLGVGWNFGFVGASAMVLECHRPEERARVQSLNDFAVFGMMVLGSFASGGLLTTYGWDTVCWVTFPPLLLAAAALVATSFPRPVPAGIIRP